MYNVVGALRAEPLSGVAGRGGFSQICIDALGVGIILFMVPRSS